jgi:hypothetical protein
VRLASPGQLVAVMPVETEPASRTTSASYGPYLVDLFSPLIDAATYFFASYSSLIQQMARATTSAS